MAFTSEFIERQRQALVNRRIQLRQEMVNMEEPVTESIGDNGDHAADAATIACHAALVDKKFAELASIDAALTRIQRGTYGICELTGQPISIDRLEAFPAVRRSVQAQNRFERRLPLTWSKTADRLG